MTPASSRFPLHARVSDTLLRRLLEIGRRADEAQGVLFFARDAFEREASECNRTRLNDASRRALECESKFAEAWLEASASWFTRPADDS